MAAKGKFDADLSALGTVLEALGSLKKDRQKWVLETAASRLGVATVVASGGSTGGSGEGKGAQGGSGGGNSGGSGAGSGGKTAKQFMKDKNPQSDVQRIACLAHFLTHERDKAHFKTKDITALNTDAARPKIGNPSQAVNNATTQSHYLTAAGKGNKQITGLGEDVVEALPNQEAVKAVETRQRPRRKKAVRKKGSRKKSGRKQ